MGDQEVINCNDRLIWIDGLFDGHVDPIGAIIYTIFVN